MKNIKFRAFATGVKEMTFFDRVIVATGELSGGKAWGMFLPSANGKVFLGGYSDPMQFTGILDKNGKEIFEGDIVNGHFENSKSNIFQVEYLDGAFQFLNVHDSSESYFWIERDLDTVEVIGNIHETPELLMQ